ncbi:DUF3108 domain-containing protein [Flavobacterium sp. TMP13]|uniref:DUF3108 domain-containing protein n=1 Tax=unclassified Flavobacterium TaxID=196869 RepID=UPI00076CA6A9|nr:DUF3108 domain-containing protein [Flavobacterium sp. TAB 87]KVV13290.1 hypothetical protein AP058_02653 [Flavobacterium sp. TAB 87]
MKKIFLLILFLPLFSFQPKTDTAFDTGEWFKFRIHYGIVNAGYATIQITDATINNKKVYHAVGKGYTTGMSRFFFKVEDLYESYFDKITGKPYRYVRKIDEGGYTKDQEGFFNQEQNRIVVKDYKRKSEKTILVTENVQDIVSSFYYLRNHPDIDNLKVGESIAIDMFFDDEITKFKLKFAGREDITTKFGTVSTMIFKPLVQKGRVFKEKESLTLWITDDKNKLPVRIKADLAVGSLKADIDGFRGLQSPLKIKK